MKAVAAYLQPEVSLDSAAGAVRAAFELRNDSSETWRASEGFAVGYHLFDAETGTLIVDGARVHTPGDVPPGGMARMTFEIAVPSEDGRYQLLLSPMREDECWYYERGWPFLLVEASTANGVSRIERVRVADAANVIGVGAAQPNVVIAHKVWNETN